ncbi:MAG: T9SS type A sorting domain-containing protein [Chitinophagales bacterium]|nr:T9SS type A sorting domain-containing protein [Chitinophagales bacterium]
MQNTTIPHHTPMWRLLAAFVLILAFQFSAQAAISIAYIRHCSSSSSNDGALEAVATGTAGPFDFAWSQGTVVNDANSSLITGLSPGTYTVTITSATGCTFTHTAVVGICPRSAGGSSSLYSSVGHEDQPGQKNGYINVQLQVLDTALMSLPIKYIWRDASGKIIAITQNISNLGAGSYTVHASNGCVEKIQTFTIFNCQAAPLLRLSMIPEPQTCKVGFTDIGKLSVRTSSEFHPLKYSWEGPGGYKDTSNSASIRPPVEGVYCVTVTDRCGQTASICQEMTCCNTVLNKLPNIRTDYECFSWQEFIFGIPVTHHRDGDFRVGFPDTPLDNICNDEFTMKWWDGTSTTAKYNSATGQWDGDYIRAITEEGYYCVTITNACGCSVKRCRAFGPEGNISGFTPTNLNATIKNITTNIGYWDLSASVLNGCFSCEGCGGGAQGVRDAIWGFQCTDNHESDLFTYDDFTPYDEFPCRGGAAINCANNPPSNPDKLWTIPEGFDGVELVDYTKKESVNLPGLGQVCVHPTYCLFPSGTVDNFPHQMPVLVKHPIGKIAAPPCIPSSPPSSSDDCPGGFIVANPNGVEENCVLNQICTSTGQIINSMSFEESIIICRCQGPGDICTTVRRCTIYQGNTNLPCNAFEIVSQNCDGDIAFCDDLDGRPGTNNRTEVPAQSNRAHNYNMVIYPNPTNGRTTITIGDFPVAGKKISLQLTDISGRLLGSEQMILNEGDTKIEYSMERYTEAPGSYILILQIQGEQPVEFLLIKTQ